MEKSRFPHKSGGVERAKGVSINFRPQACSPPKRLLESVEQRLLQETDGNRRCAERGWGRRLEVLHLRLAAPSSLWEAWRRGLFTPCTHRRPGQSVGAAPYVTHLADQPALTVLIRRQSSRGGSGAVDGPVRAGEAACELVCCRRRRCSARGARTDPFSSGRLEGARTVASRGLELQDLDWAGRVSPIPAPSVSRSGPGRRQVQAPLARKNSPAWPPRPLQPRSGKVWGEGAGLCAEGL